MSFGSMSQSSWCSSMHHGKQSLTPNETRERSRILDSSIRSIYLGLNPCAEERAPVVGQLGYAAAKAATMVRFFLPDAISSAFVEHASIYADIGMGNLGLLIEFGRYSGDDVGFPNKIYYWRQDGARFSLMDYRSFINRVNGTIFDGFVFPCKVQSMTVRKLFETVHQYQSWGAGDYNLEFHNCQHFIKEVLAVLHAKRPDHLQNNHSVDKLKIPEIILHQLEEEEDNAFDKLQRIVYIGPFFGLGYKIAQFLSGDL